MLYVWRLVNGLKKEILDPGYDQNKLHHNMLQIYKITFLPYIQIYNYDISIGTSETCLDSLLHF